MRRSPAARAGAETRAPGCGPLARLAVGLIRAYQIALSPWLGPACRFEPSCSSFATEAIRRHGLPRGSRLAAARLLRCHPWGGSGYDPVPAGPDAVTSGRDPSSRLLEGAHGP